MDKKYVVFKKEALDDLLVSFADKLSPPVGDALNTFVSKEVQDAVVIRRQDVFAPPALDMYANAIQIGVQVSNYDPEVKQRLTEIADYFHEQAALAWDMHRKIPD